MGTVACVSVRSRDIAPRYSLAIECQSLETRPVCDQRIIPRAQPKLPDSWPLSHQSTYIPFRTVHVGEARLAIINLA